MKSIIAFFKKEDGQGMVEYGLILALIAMVVVVALGFLGSSVSDTFVDLNEKLPNGA